MKNLIFLYTLYIALKMRGVLPKGNWKISRKDYYGQKLKMRNWRLYSPNGSEKDENGDYVNGVHILGCNGLWDAEKREHIAGIWSP